MLNAWLSRVLGHELVQRCAAVVVDGRHRRVVTHEQADLGRLAVPHSYVQRCVACVGGHVQVLTCIHQRIMFLARNLNVLFSIYIFLRSCKYFFA